MNKTNYEKEIEIFELKIKVLELELELAKENGKIVQPSPVGYPPLAPQPPFKITCGTSSMSGYKWI